LSRAFRWFRGRFEGVFGNLFALLLLWGIYMGVKAAIDGHGQLGGTPAGSGLPFWVAAALSFANTMYGLLILPESLPRDRRSPVRWPSANPVGALHLLRADRVLTGLSVANFFAQLAHVVLPSTFVLYASYRYGWNPATVGLTLAMVGICAMAVQGLAIGPIVRRIGERRAGGGRAPTGLHGIRSMATAAGRPDPSSPGSLPWASGYAERGTAKGNAPPRPRQDAPHDGRINGG